MAVNGRVGIELRRALTCPQPLAPTEPSHKRNSRRWREKENAVLPAARASRARPGRQDGDRRRETQSKKVCIIRIMKSAEVIRRLKRDGWVFRNVRGSHHQCVHPEKPGRVTVKHPSKEIPIGTLRNIYRQANWKWEDR